LCPCIFGSMLSFPTRRSSDLFEIGDGSRPINSFDWGMDQSTGSRLNCRLYRKDLTITTATFTLHQGTTPVAGTEMGLWRRCSPTDRKSTRLNSSHGSISYAVY